jgi:hypothetical protein
VSEVVESTAEEVGTEVVPTPTGPPTLWRTEDPVEILQRAKQTADALAPVIRAAGLVSNISGKDYLQVEAWQTLGQQVGVTPVVTETRRLTNPDGWEARCEARTLDGRTIGAADSMCTRDETTEKGTKRWADSNEFEIRSMAQTRAMSRALASVLRFIPTLAGFSGTPAEEMSGVQTRNSASTTTPASEKQRKYAEKLLRDSSLSDDAKHAVWKWGQAGGTTLCKPRASEIIEALKEGQTGELLGKAGYSELPADTEGLQVDTSDFEDDGKFAPEQAQQFVEASRPDDESE